MKSKEAIIKDKIAGLSDIEIGKKYKITYRELEKIIREFTGVSVSAIREKKKIKHLQPKDFKEETTTVWSFKNRGNWATHSGEYRGNWSPYIPRNVILKYSKPGELVLDYFCGAGTTAVEAKLLGRRCIAFDINDMAIELAKKNVSFELPQKELPFQQKYEPELYVGDARDLSSIEDNSIDLICSHPPYANIIHYTDHKDGDLSFLDIHEFLEEMKKVAQESFRVLKPNRQCAILIGDLRRHRHVVPLGFHLINIYLKAGFKLKELVIKRQHNCKTTGFWYANSIKFNFLLLAHEYLPIFEKPQLTPIRVSEEIAGYDALNALIKRYKTYEKLRNLETTTVWLFPESKIEKLLTQNVVQRYGNNNYKIIAFDKSETAPFSYQRKKRDLIFIKIPFIDKTITSKNEIEVYQKKILDVVKSELSFLNQNGFCIIQVKDIRLHGYIEPMAKLLVDSISYNGLRLKEIVIVSREEQKSVPVRSEDNVLDITHQYLLIYEYKGE